jgi:hypothetical protein
MKLTTQLHLMLSLRIRGAVPREKVPHGMALVRD